MPRIIVIGTSLGGLSALSALFKDFPPDFAIPMAVVQHRSADSTTLARELRRATSVRIEEPSDGQAVASGTMWLAPAGYHLLVEDGVFRLSTEAPVSYARPSIDVLFESAAEMYGKDVVGVVLTGANADGSRGSRRIAQAGGKVIVQDPANAECPVMPRAALALAQNSTVLTLGEIQTYLARVAIEK